MPAAPSAAEFSNCVVARGGGRIVEPAISSAPVVAQWLPPALMIAGVVVLGIIGALMMRGRLDQTRRLQTDELELQRKAQAMVHELEDLHTRVAELIAASQQWSARLDDRAARLGELIEQADARMQTPAPSINKSRASSAPGASIPPATIERKPISRFDPLSKETKQVDPLAKSVYDLADSGHEPLQIAQELGEEVGKVELILALRRM